jgi:glycosyltransferase involved in cell wall biosynthesis
MNPEISIILPTYNGEKYISEAMKSCLNQTFTNFELIIVNDCSSDNTLSILKSFEEKDNRIKIINNQSNLKLPASLNIGFQHASGKYFTWTSDDNSYENNALRILHDAFLKNNSLDIVYSSYRIIDVNDAFIAKFGGHPEEIIFRNIVGACFLFKKDVFNKLQGYDEMKYMIEDYDFWLRAFKYFEFKFIDKCLYTYRRHSSTISSKIYTNQKVYSEFIRLHFESFREFYTRTFEIYFSPEEIDTLISIYLNNFIKDDPYSTIQHYYNCNRLLTKLEKINWRRINFNQDRIAEIIELKRLSMTEKYIDEVFFWKSEFEDKKFCFRKKYIKPSFWIKKTREFFSTMAIPK